MVKGLYGIEISKDWKFDPAKAITFATKKRDEQGGEDPPFVNYVRHLAWSEEFPCAFCGSTKGIHDRYGRYLTGEEDDEGCFTEESRVYFCGLCLEELEKMCDMDFG